LMYWQVYFHKTVISSEQLLLNTLRRANELAQKGIEVFATPYLKFFLNKELNVPEYIKSTNPDKRKVLLDNFSLLEDNDIIVSAKVWANHSDATLSWLSQKLIARKLYRVEIQPETFSEGIISQYKLRVLNDMGVDENDLNYFVFTGEITNHTYKFNDERIKILRKNGDVVDITEMSDLFDRSIQSKSIIKHYLCYPKEVKDNHL